MASKRRLRNWNPAPARTAERAQAILCYDGRKLTVRNDEHDMGDHALHYTFN